ACTDQATGAHAALVGRVRRGEPRRGEADDRAGPVVPGQYCLGRVGKVDRGADPHGSPWGPERGGASTVRIRRRTDQGPTSHAPAAGMERPLVHLPELTCPCCRQALGEFSKMTPHEGSRLSIPAPPGPFRPRGRE